MGFDFKNQENITSAKASMKKRTGANPIVNGF